MSSSLSSLVDNLSEEIHNDKCADCNSYFEYISTKDKQLIFKCIKCNKNHKKHFNKDLIERFVSTYEFCDRDINKFFLMLRKVIYQYEYINIWERFKETSLPDKVDFYSNLNMEDITDDYVDLKWCWLLACKKEHEKTLK